MIYGSVCSGIEAATVAWHPLGWRPAFFAEIDPFPRAVLAHHYPDTPCHGDFTTIEADQYDAIDLLVGGTPCQSFSIAGLRGGLADDRGNLALEFLRLADRTRARWLVWENVPGVLSSNGGRDFGAILGGMAELGYGTAYRVLDAQHFGVPQRRRRVFVVGYLGDWRRAAAVLFERHSLSGHPAPRREKGQETARSLRAQSQSSHREDSDNFVPCDGGVIERWPADIAPTLNAAFGSKQGLEDQHIRGGADSSLPEIAMCLNAGGMGRQDAETETLIPTTGAVFDDAVTHSLRGEGFDASEDGMGRGTPLVPVHAIQERAVSENADAGPDGAGFRSDGMAYTLEARTVPQAIAFSAKDHGADAMLDCSPKRRAGGHSGSHANAGVMPAVAFSIMPMNSGKDYKARETDGAQPIMAGGPVGGNQGGDFVKQASAVRRLTPRECERLQGFPDDYTLVPYRNKPAADGPRYKALGNSMAVPVMAWIGERIAMVDAIIESAAA